MNGGGNWQQSVIEWALFADIAPAGFGTGTCA